MTSSSLEVPRRRPSASRSRLWGVIAIIATVVLVVGWVVWFVRTPDDLPTSTRTVDGASVVGQEIYVGMFAVGDDFERTIEISEIEVDVEADGDVEVTPKLCRDGSISVTTDASGWCPELADPEGAEFDAGDSVVLVVSAAEPTQVEIGRIEISFREGVRSGTLEAGLRTATLTFAEHDPGTVQLPEPEAPEDDSGERPGEDDETENKDKKGDRKKDKNKDQPGENA